MTFTAVDLLPFLNDGLQMNFFFRTLNWFLENGISYRKGFIWIIFLGRFRRKNLNYFNFYDYKNTIFTCEGNNLKLFHQLDPPSENKEKKNMSIVTTHVFITINVISKWTEYIFMVTNKKFQLISLTNPKTTTKTFTTKSLSRGIYEKER